MTLPYEGATSGAKAMDEVQKILKRFGCQSFGHMMDFENKKLIVQFKYRNIPITVEASTAGYAAAWLREHPWTIRMKKSKAQHEAASLAIASCAVYSILRDWIKGQITAVECGILSFEGAFLGQILLPSGKTVLQHVEDNKMLALEGKNQ
jgi:hypothetical protein